MTSSFDRWAKARRDLLEIDNPVAECGHCRFTNVLTGVWSVEDGRLVFRADADPLRRRGPDFHSCGESDEVTAFKKITVGGRVLAAEEVAALQATAEVADRTEFDDA